MHPRSGSNFSPQSVSLLRKVCRSLHGCRSRLWCTSITCAGPLVSRTHVFPGFHRSAPLTLSVTIAATPFCRAAHLYISTALISGSHQANKFTNELTNSFGRSRFTRSRNPRFDARITDLVLASFQIVSQPQPDAAETERPDCLLWA